MENVNSVQSSSYQPNTSSESSVKPREEVKKENNGSKEANIQKISDSKIIDITG